MEVAPITERSVAFRTFVHFVFVHEHVSTHMGDHFPADLAGLLSFPFMYPSNVSSQVNRALKPLGAHFADDGIQMGFLDVLSNVTQRPFADASIRRPPAMATNELGQAQTRSFDSVVEFRGVRSTVSHQFVRLHRQKPVA